MKTRSFLLSTLAVFIFAGCSSEDAREGNIPGGELDGKAYLSLSLQSHTATSRAANVEEKPGSSGESKAGAVKVLLFDKDDVCLDVADFDGLTVGNSGGESGGTGTPEAVASDAKLVPEKTKKVFVVINPYTDGSKGWSLTADAVKGKPWSAINTAIEAVIANIATNDNFMMASAGEGAGIEGALMGVTVHKPDGYTQDKIDAAKKEAKDHPAEISVDRLSAKVELAVKEAFTTKPDGAKFTFGGWELSVTNKSVKLYSELITYDNATNGAVYRRDNNYLLSEQPVINTGNKKTDEANLMVAFDYLKNIDNESDDIPAVVQTNGSSLYCLENTMEAKAQQLGFTTKVVVKATYTPSGLNENSSYFSWKGNYYTLDQLKTEYLKHSDGSGLKVDLPIFLKKAGIMTQEQFDGDQDTKNSVVASLSEGATATQLNAKTGIIGRFCAVRYYHESVCYYDVLIRHDQNVTEKMALGRYGVVRNNWYHLELQSVSGPGTPWIPDPSDPDNPTPPGTDDDEADAYISVKITINPWTYWTQGVDLH